MKYLSNKPFSVYANYNNTPKCQMCGIETTVFYNCIEGRLCGNCLQKVKQKHQEEKIKKLIEKAVDRSDLRI
jgi:hypothetical protein